MSTVSAFGEAHSAGKSPRLASRAASYAERILAVVVVSVSFVSIIWGYYRPDPFWFPVLGEVLFFSSQFGTSVYGNTRFVMYVPVVSTLVVFEKKTPRWARSLVFVYPTVLFHRVLYIMVPSATVAMYYGVPYVSKAGKKIADVRLPTLPRNTWWATWSSAMVVFSVFLLFVSWGTTADGSHIIPTREITTGPAVVALVYVSANILRSILSAMKPGERAPMVPRRLREYVFLPVLVIPFGIALVAYIVYPTGAPLIATVIELVYLIISFLSLSLDRLIPRSPLLTAE